MDIPVQITTAADALNAADVYLAWRPPNDFERVTPGYVPWGVGRATEARKRLAELLTALDRHPGGLGPVVEVRSPGVAARLVGKPLARPTMWKVVEPEADARDVRYGDSLGDVVEVAADVAALRALAARCIRCADSDREHGRGRQADRLEHEATELIAYAAALETQHVQPLAAVWLADWRAEAATREPQPKRGPLSRPVQLR